MKKCFSNRFSLFLSVGFLYLILSFLTRIALLVWTAKDVDFNLIYFLRLFFTGFVFDLTVSLAFLSPYAFYLLLFPKRWIGSFADRIFTYFYVLIVLIIFFFSTMAEFPFWDEFGVRFNFIAVDYLIYTYEVVSNINQSYPLPVIIGVLLGLVALTFYLFRKWGITKAAFSNKMSFKFRAIYGISALSAAFLLLNVMKNEQAEFSGNLVINELGKNGIFSFFTAYRSNELDYDTFYPKLNQKEAYSILKKNLLQSNQKYGSDDWDNIMRITKGENNYRPNIILIAIESFSAEFLSAFGNKDELTPNYEKLADKSIFFTNMYATGTRTVRGMEALTLSVPPTPGNSIVRRPNNQKLFSVATIMKEKNYQLYFIYGGDGYFDNMNNFFGGQGFDIVDRDRGNPLSDKIDTRRYNIQDEYVSFENAWGVCDEDIYKQAIICADKNNQKGKPFFQFIMTTSNHRPYTFPDGKIDLPQGSRNSAVKYTDYALGKFIDEAQKKAWFDNTVFVIVADHCASSAGKWEINIDKHHIPAIIYNLPVEPQKIDRMVSQIDLMPTLFGYLDWNYNTALYGKDINKMQEGEERAFIGNYRTLGLLKNNIFTQIDDRKRTIQYKVSENDQTLSPQNIQDKELVNETISYYQTASERFKNGKMKE